MRLSLHKSNNNASLPSSKKGIITLIHIDEIIAMPKTDYQGIRCLNEIQLKENPQLQYLYLTPFTQKEEITPSGDIESTLFSTKISGTFPGNKIEAAEFLKDNINEPFVIIYEDFTENTKCIYGSKYHPLFIKSEYKSDSTGKLWNFTLEQSHASDTPYLYYDGPQLGGRNLLLNSATEYNFSARVLFSNINNLKGGDTISLSYDAKYSGGTDGLCIQILNGDTSYSGNVVKRIDISNSSYTRIKSENIKLPDTLDNLRIVGYISGAGTGTGNAKNFKLEKGTKATDWTPAPEDIII